MRGLCRWFRACFWCFSARCVGPCAFGLALWANVLFLSFPYGKVTNLLAMLVGTCSLRYLSWRNLRRICKELRGICTELRGICEEFIPFHSLPPHFLKNFHQNPCTSQSYSLPLPSLELQCGALRINKGRGYMFKPDQHFLLRLWAYFFARNLPHRIRARPLFMRSTPHSVEMQIKIYGGSPSTCFYCPLWRKSIRVLADEEVRAAFFVPLRQPVPDGFGQKG